MVYVLSNKVEGDGTMASMIASDHIMLVRPSIVVPGNDIDVLVAHQNWMIERRARARKVSPPPPLDPRNLPPGVEEQLKAQYDVARRDAPVSGLLGVMLHEMGHAIDKIYATPSGDDSKVYRSDQDFYKSQNPEGFEALREYIKSEGSGSYAGKAYAEAYAEAFSAWVIDGGNPRSPEVRAIAEAFGWAEQFPEVVKMKTRPEVFRNLEGSDV
jgi:hypothetical protein